MTNLPPRTRRLILDVCLMMESDLSFSHTVETLAAYAGMSKFHFQRAFHAVVGEPPIAYLRRLRLERAAHALKYADCPITQIALSAGFESHVGFTHAFNKRYGCSPSEFRGNHLVKPFLRLPSHTPVNADYDTLASLPITVQIERSPTLRIALKRFVGPMQKMAGVWVEMLAWCKHRGLQPDDCTFMGLYHDDWNDAQADLYRYDAAVAIDANFEPDDQVNVSFIPGGETAVVSFSGSLNQMDKHWRLFYHSWLPASGYQPRLSYVFDRYPSSLISESPLRRILRTLTGLTATLCLPITTANLPLDHPD